MAGFKFNQKGFTLIELMIVVGIIGILVAIAAPNFSRYQSKARQSEAKIALAAVYGAEKSFYSEYAAYLGLMDAIGYTPEGAKRFYAVGFAPGTPGTVNGFSGSATSTNTGWDPIGNSFQCPGAASAGGVAALPPVMTGTDPQNFTAGAVGCIRQQSSPAVLDGWNITDVKILSNNSVGL